MTSLPRTDSADRAAHRVAAGELAALLDGLADSGGLVVEARVAGARKRLAEMEAFAGSLEEQADRLAEWRDEGEER